MKRAVLIVGESSGFAKFFKTNFPEHNIIYTDSGIEGLELCKNKKPRIAFIDSNLTDVQPSELIKVISKDYFDIFTALVGSKNKTIPDEILLLPAPFKKEIVSSILENHLKSRTCLIVDDISFNRKKAAALLKKIGFKVEEADKATDVGKFFNTEYKGKIDVILIDQHMPEIKGSTFIEIVRNSKFSEIPILLYSAIEDEKATEDLVRKVGAAGFLPKNLTIETLTKEFNRLGIL